MRDAGPILAAVDLCLGYGAERILADVNLAVCRGESWFLLGKNGAGKTTFLKAVLGQISPQAGSLRLDAALASRERLGVVPQRCDLNPSLPTTVREFVTLGFVGLHLERRERQERLAWALDEAALAERRTAQYWALSGGMRQRALVARALVRRPELLILDEPTNGLDPANEEALLELFARLNRRDRTTVLFVTHDADVAARYASHVALFHAGRVVAGPRADTLKPESLRRIYGLGMETGEHEGGDARRGRSAQ
jgi:ABC-type Mn2+/Zn2+ transport system ATPase subunit